jgi:integrase
VSADIHVDTARVMYADLRAAFFSDYQVNQRKSLRRDKEGNAYLDKVGRLDSFFDGYRASEISADLVRKFIADQQRKGLANGSINRSISALRRMFNIARQDGRLRNVPYFPMLKEAPPRQGFFEHEHCEILSRCLPDYLRLPLALGFFTAMRLAEIQNLTWDQIDFLHGLISLRAGETKNGGARTIPIVPQLRALLKVQFGKRSDCPYVCFRVERTGQSVKLGSFRKAWYAGCIRAKLGKMVAKVDASGSAGHATPRGPRSKPKVKMVYQGMIFHDLRRSGVRNLVRAGVSEKLARDISGHRTSSVFSRYDITSKNDVIEAGKNLASFHGGMFGDNSGTIAVPHEAVAKLSN